ncbi:MAG: DUF4058 family protein [Gemmataceae bacterium]
MPLLDHFAPPIADHAGWQSVHSAWINAIVRRLNESVLPESYLALPTTTVAGIEVDVATLRNGTGAHAASDDPPASSWVPPPPAVTAVIDFTAVREFEVRVFYDRAERDLVAAIELVSPANKDRPSERRAFAAKCANYLLHRTSVIVIDAVTDRRADLHAELTGLLDAKASVAWASPTGLSAIAYRPVADDGSRLEIWPATLEVGQPLPELPLWLGIDGPVPLDLEATYVDACRSLRIRV